MATAFDLKSLSKPCLKALETIAKPDAPDAFAATWLSTMTKRAHRLLDAGRSPGEAAASLVATTLHSCGLGHDPAKVQLVEALVSAAINNVLSAQARALAAIEQAEADELAMAEAAKKARVRAAVARNLQGGA